MPRSRPLLGSSLWLAGSLLAGNATAALAQVTPENPCILQLRQADAGTLRTAPCGLPKYVADEIEAKLIGLRRDLKLSTAQQQAFGTAADQMLGLVLAQYTVLGQRLDKLPADFPTDFVAIFLPVAVVASKQPAIEITAETRRWITQFDALLVEAGKTLAAGDVERQALDALRRVDLHLAGKQLDAAIATAAAAPRGEPAAAAEADIRQAARHRLRAQMLALQYKPAERIPHLDQAHRLQPESADFAVDLAQALHEQGRGAEAVAVYRLLADRYRAQAKDGNLRFRTALATTLNAMGGVQAELKRWPDAEVSQREALELWKGMAQEGPIFRSRQAATEYNLAGLYAEQKKDKDAETAYRGVVALRQELVKADPAEKNGLVAALTNLAALYADADRDKEAEAAYKELLPLQRELLQKDASYRATVAATLGNLAMYAANADRNAEAEGLYQESVALRREVVKGNPGARAGLAAMLYNLAALQAEMNKNAEAETAYKESLALRRELSRDNPAPYKASIAATLNNLAILFNEQKKLKEAEDAYRESIALRRDLAKETPERHKAPLGSALYNLGVLYGNTKRPQQAELMYRESLLIRRELAASNPKQEAALKPAIATTLYNLGVISTETQRLADAEAAYKESVELRRALFKADARKHGKALKSVLRAYAGVLEQLDRAAERKPLDAEVEELAKAGY